MSIATSTAKVQYTLATAVQALPIPFYFLQNADIKAIRARSGAVDYTMILGTDYTLTGAGDEAGGTLTTIATNLQAGDIITIKRSVVIDQQTNYVYNDKFPAEVHEKVADKLTMIAQQLKEVTDRAVQFPETEVAGTGNIMPAAAGRASKILGFDATGNAVQLFDPVSAVFAEGEHILCNSAAALKAVSVTGLTNGQQAQVAGYASPGDGGGGLWTYLSASAETEDFGLVLAPNVGTGRWIRTFTGPASAKWFGAKGDGVTDDTVALQAAIACSVRKGVAIVLPPGTYLITDTLTGVTSGVASQQSFSLQGTRFNSQFQSLSPTKIKCSTGATWTNKPAITNGRTGRTCQVRDLTIEGPGATFGSGTSGFYHAPFSQSTKLENVFITGFETGVLIGDATDDGNADWLTAFNLRIEKCEFGVWSRASQCYNIWLFGCTVQARICFINYTQTGSGQTPPGFYIYGGFAGSHGELTFQYKEATITSVNTGAVTITVDDIGTVASDFNANRPLMNIWVFIPRMGFNMTGTSVPVATGSVLPVMSVAGNTLTLFQDFGGLNGSGLGVGQKVQIWRPNITFLMNYGFVSGIHMEGNSSGNQRKKPIVIVKTGRQGVLTIQNCRQNVDAEARTLLSVLTPFCWHEGDVTNDCKLVLRENHFTSAYARFFGNIPEIWCEGNYWNCKPHFHSTEGYYNYRDVTLQNERYNLDFPGLASLPDIETKYIRESAKNRDDADANQYPIYHRSGLAAADRVALPTKAWSRDTFSLYLNSAGTQRIALAKCTNTVPGYYSGTAITATMAINAGSNIGTVTNANGLFAGRVIAVTGAGGGGGTLTAVITEVVRINHADYGADTIRVTLSANAGTTVSTAAIAGVAPTIRQFSDSVDYSAGSAPVRNGYFRGEKVWNESAATGQPMGWMWDGSAWKAMANLA